MKSVLKTDVGTGFGLEAAIRLAEKDLKAGWSGCLHGRG
jgi:hypothetical protein